MEKLNLRSKFSRYYTTYFTMKSLAKYMAQDLNISNNLKHELIFFVSGKI